MSNEEELQAKNNELTETIGDLSTQLDKALDVISSLTKDKREELITKIAELTEYSREEVLADVADAKPMEAIKILNDKLTFIAKVKTSTASVRGIGESTTGQDEEPKVGYLDRFTGKWVT